MQLLATEFLTHEQCCRTTEEACEQPFARRKMVPLFVPEVCLEVQSMIGPALSEGLDTENACRMQSGPDLDFESLVSEHYASLYRFALSLSRNEADGSDLVQQTFYLWAKKGHQLLDPSRVKSWLFTTLHREFLGRQRHVTKFPHYELTDAEPELPEIPPELPLHLDWQIVTECLSAIDPAFQAPVSLFYLEDYSYNEIGEILEIPLGTVKSRIARGIAQMQRLLSKRMTARPQTEPKACEDGRS